MEPLAALSVAAAIVPFVDWSREVVCKSKELYDSADGVLKENLERETVAGRLKRLTEDLRASRSSNQKNLSPRLEQICQECTVISDELLMRLHLLKVPKGSEHRKWKTLRHALKSVWSKTEIDEMAKRLNGLRAELDTELLVANSMALTKLSFNSDVRIDRMEADIQNILSLISSTSDENQIRNQIQTLTEPQRDQVRAHLGKKSFVSNTTYSHLDEKTKEAIGSFLESHVQAMTTRPKNKREQNSQTRLGSFFRYLSSRRRHAELAHKSQHNVRDILVQEDVERRTTRVHLALLDSLRFESLDDRSEAIAKAHEQTFQWIYDDSSHDQKPWHSFRSWLQEEGAGVYWIHGKPASGKSTLMKFICNNPLTQRYLSHWVGGERLLTGVFYYWNSGQEAQRSQEGLFRTLLYDALRANRDLLPHVFPDEWDRMTQKAAYDLEITREIWSLGRLKRAFENLVNLAAPHLRLCFFVDGIDEAEGDPDEIADFLVELSKTSPHVKFCLSSRPLAGLTEIFGRVPSLRLQDLTRTDIMLYVRERLLSNKSVQKFSSRQPQQVEWLIKEIVDKASGVFLWVTLVVNSLISGIRSGDDAEELSRRLQELPDDLDSLYDRIFAQIQTEHPVESAKIFQLFRANGNHLELLLLHLALTYSPEEVLWMKTTPMEESLTNAWCDQRKQLLETGIQRLSSRCRCLLEVNAEDFMFEEGLELHQRNLRHLQFWAIGEVKTRLEVKIRYLHRTTRDYMEQPRIWQKILDQTKDLAFNPGTCLLVACVAGIKRDHGLGDITCGSILEVNISQLPLDGTQVDIDLLYEWDRAYSARELEANLVEDGRDIKSDIQTDSYSLREGPIWQGDYTLDKHRGHFPWLNDTKTICTRPFFYVSDQRGFPVAFSRFAQGFQGSPLRFCILSFFRQVEEGMISLSLIELFLEMGCDPNEQYLGQSIWEYVVHVVHDYHGTRSRKRQYICQSEQHELLYILAVMLKHGANPHAQCTEHISSMARSETARLQDEGVTTICHFATFQTATIDSGQRAGAHSVESVIRDTFTDDCIMVYAKELLAALRDNRLTTLDLRLFRPYM
ncbi:hypothetical protein B0T17DRAFT_658185 [Bombardia bombarda]|uniref:NACHT domain-containing protein n=1 Tax=Bombardia bombarda TaxID=252184 RepID=A0AA39WAJ7_9PEZI|nr:hypothetical protein B0T17DRAFT_658185 [Bombardia bombarda]